ncbi:MAG: hypothetical protein H0V83_00100 [Rubrobacter sp.]|jgi:hypothetical protein|nr:hypothetical protein [Rubrobacter sp.]
MEEPVVLGVPANPNAVTAVVCVIIGWLGFALAASGIDPARREPTPGTLVESGGSRVTEL